MSIVGQGGIAAGNKPTTRARGGRRRRRIEPYAWLTAGAVSVGIGAAAFAGAGVASADDTASDSSSVSSSASASSESATDRPTKREAVSADASEPGSSERGDRTAEGDSESDDEATTDDDSGEPPAQPSDEDGDVAESDSDETDSDESGVEVATDAQPDPATTDRSRDRSPRLTHSDDATVAADVPTVDADTAIPTAQEPDPPGLADPPPSDSAEAVVSTAAQPAATAVAAPTPVDADTAVPQEQSALSVSVMDAQVSSAAQPAEAPAPRSLVDLVTAFFLRLQPTYVTPPPTATRVQTSAESSQTAVEGTVATDSGGAAVTVKLSVKPTHGDVQVREDGTYTYMPSAALAASGGTDTFSVTVTTANPPETGWKALWSAIIRALTFGLVKPAVSTTVTKTVTVTVPKTTDADIDTTPPPPTSSKYDAGLSDPFQMPSASTGSTLNVRDYGATSNKSSDNDATAIQKAINAAKAGDMVYIPNGTYHIKSTIILKTGVSLIGQSRDATVLASAFGTSPHAMIYAAPNVSNLTLSSFKITQASGRTVKAAVRLGLNGTAGTVSRIVVKDLYIEKFERFGIQLQNAYQVLVDGNVIRNATALDGGGSGYGILIDQSRSSNNWIRNNDIGPVIRHAILVQMSAHHNLIENNRITGTVSGAIDLHGEDEYSNEIRYNTIWNGVRNGTTVSPNGAGIEVGEFSGTIGSTAQHDNSGANNWIHHNVVYGYSHGLRIVNNSNYTYIEDNTFYNNLGSGILADLAPLNNLHISGNNIYDNGSGITLYDVTKAFVTDNVVRDNTNYGIWTNAGTTGYTVTGNTVTGNRVDVTLGSRNGVYSADL